jgi:hypothetical protein
MFSSDLTSGRKNTALSAVLRRRDHREQWAARRWPLLKILRYGATLSDGSSEVYVRIARSPVGA